MPVFFTRRIIALFFIFQANWITFAILKKNNISQ
jgi:hypothetical protein